MSGRLQGLHGSAHSALCGKYLLSDYLCTRQKAGCNAFKQVKEVSTFINGISKRSELLRVGTKVVL